MVGTRFLILALLMCSLTCADAQKPSWKYGAAKIRGWQAEAIAVALREFQKHQGGKTDRGEPVYGELRHYAVYVSQSPPNEVPAREECVRVAFAPDFSAKDWREHIVGGRTSFGIEVSYDISKRTLKIVKTSFARYPFSR
jgi:hypothetical protein